MVSELDVRLADLAVELQVLDRPRMQQVLTTLQQHPSAPPLAHYLVQQGLVRPETLEQLKQEWFRRNPPAAEDREARPRGLTQRYVPPEAARNGNPQGSGAQPRPNPQGSGGQPRNPSGPQGSAVQPRPASESTPGSGVLSPVEDALDMLLGKLLISKSLVSPDVIRELYGQRQSQGMRLGRLLVERQQLPADRLRQALQFLNGARRVCSGCGLEVAAQSLPPSCAQCGGAWFEDSFERIMGTPARQNGATAGPAPQASPGPPPSLRGEPPPLGPNASGSGVPSPLGPGPGPGGGPGGGPGPGVDPGDFLNMPAAYTNNPNTTNWQQMLPTSSMRMSVAQLKAAAAAQAPPPLSGSSSDALDDLGKSMDELNLGASIDELNILPGKSSDEAIIPEAKAEPPPKPTPAAPPAAAPPKKGSAADVRTNVSAEFPDFKQLQQLTQAKQTKKFSRDAQAQPGAKAATKKKGCLKKSAALLLFGLALTAPAVSYAVSLFASAGP